MNKFLNKLSVCFFISQIVEIDFSHCDTFKDIKKELIKFIAKCENLRHLNLDYCNKNVEDVMTIIKVAANFQFLEELSLKEDFDHHQLVQLRNNEKEIFQLLRNKLLSNIKFRLCKREKDELRDFRYLFKLIENLKTNVSNEGDIEAYLEGAVAHRLIMDDSTQGLQEEVKNEIHISKYIVKYGENDKELTFKFDNEFNSEVKKEF